MYYQNIAKLFYSLLCFSVQNKFTELTFLFHFKQILMSAILDNFKILAVFFLQFQARRALGDFGILIALVVMVLLDVLIKDTCTQVRICH